MKSKDAQIAELQEQLRHARALEIKGVAPRPIGEPQRYKVLVYIAQLSGLFNNTSIVVLVSDFKFDSIEDALEAIRQGEFVVVLDNENRENEGDLIAAASEMTPEKMAFMIRHTR